MTATQTARDRARAELTREIKSEARRQLAAEGAQRLSLRAVARELGMASSALYRYFSSRDDLLTALIIAAYDAIGESAVRGWAITHPNEYALIYGSPVPGYSAPEETIAPASRMAALLGCLLSDAWSARLTGGPADARPDGLLQQPLAGPHLQHLAAENHHRRRRHPKAAAPDAG